MTYQPWMAVPPVNDDPRLLRPRCPKRTVRYGEPCGRLPGHKWECRPEHVQERDRAARRRRYAEATQQHIDWRKAVGL